jgi:hypothetical protein
VDASIRPQRVVRSFRGVGRYQMTDQFIARTLFKTLGWSETAFGKVSGRPSNWPELSALFVDELVVALALARRDALPGDPTISVPKVLARAYERRAAERRADPRSQSDTQTRS